MEIRKINILSRGSLLAERQVQEVMANFPYISFKIHRINTFGDLHKDVSLIENLEDDSFTREIDEFLSEGKADIAIHSAKDMPFPLKKGLKLIALTRAVSNTYSLVSRNNLKLKDLPSHSKLGTSSAQCKEQILSKRPDLQIISIRGTIAERLELLRKGIIDGLIIATCALQRLGLIHLSSEILDFKTHPLQGMLGIVTREDNDSMDELFSSIDIRKTYGKVFLTGFGPGNPEYLTLKALRVLEHADIIFYDDLIDKEYISRFKAIKVYVGKRSGKHSKRQEEINELLYTSVCKALMVVRLKGGDPFIFGRGGEELLFLLKRYVPVEIIPGISSALAGASESGIPLTQREISSSLIFTSGQNNKSLNFNPRGTTVVYMAGKHLPEIVSKAIDCGYDGNTPAAVLTNISLPGSKTLTGSLNEMLNKKPVPDAPTLLIIGSVIHKKRVDYYLDTFSKVLVTDTSSEGYENHGLVTHSPLIEIIPLKNFSTADKLIQKIHDFDIIIFTSRYGVRHFFDRIYQTGGDTRSLHGILILGIGADTSKELRDHGIVSDMQPEVDSSEGIIRYFRSKAIVNRKILIPGSDPGLNVLPDGLSKLGNSLTLLEIYKTVMPSEIKRQNLEDFKYIAFSSPSCVENFCTVYPVIPPRLKFIIKGNETRRKMIEKGLIKSHVNEYMHFIPAENY